MRLLGLGLLLFSSWRCPPPRPVLKTALKDGWRRPIATPLAKLILRKIPAYMGEVMPAINEIMIDRLEMYNK
ncbi:MAG: hypothetical protein VCE75_26320 [Alphaproteobacteria bacterium]